MGTDASSENFTVCLVVGDLGSALSSVAVARARLR
jgi:hypothetical protein